MLVSVCHLRASASILAGIQVIIIRGTTTGTATMILSGILITMVAGVGLTVGTIPTIHTITGTTIGATTIPVGGHLHGQHDRELPYGQVVVCDQA